MSIIGFVLLLKPRFKKHPYRLFAWEIIINGAYFIDGTVLFRSYKVHYEWLAQIVKFWRPVTYKEKYFFWRSALNRSV